jgi:hypothetical protein
MKTTIDIPELLYKKAKIRAIERGQTLKQIVLTSLEKELNPSGQPASAHTSPLANRQLLPAFARLQAAGAFKPRPGSRDITELLSEDRDDRPV